ncbi:CDP-diacylglycerol--serine O-phosphatidyltransferase [Uliginosibacterium sp. H3]|uniref:CDP-diacylglycerol--serine O-phosphatidyltransferase n=1 Tax=Uliginosibacterium silvisoli TaxID=3114758 RepID=A0ABU6K2W4_9RHOO|nr:CDP-diacylglycerol--serine O-phosphatidyltransferase [Uliginosibacterium sp. H3]
MSKETSSPRPERRRRGIYILPNLFTSAALFGGFYAIVQAMNGRFEHACVAVFVAMILDALDGRVARMTNTQSAFGAEYDSLSDMVSFGAAPSLVIYEWAMRDLGKLGWIAAFIYCVCAALRLARFNTNIDVIDKRFFQGLPSPAAAALVTGFVWVMIDNGVGGEDYFLGLPVPYLACAITAFAGISMVSSVFFYSGKDFNLRRSVPFAAAIALIVILLFVSSYPPGVLFGVFVCYALSGYVMTLVRRLRKRSARASHS